LYENDYKKIALTFDDGPDIKYTEKILDILSEYGIKATFFVIGVNAEKYPDIISREIKEGHELGNHTYHHYFADKISQDILNDEIEANDRLIYELTEYRMKIFRPPGGSCSEYLSALSSELGLPIILWNIDTLDWRGDCAAEISNRVLDNIKSGDIILCHDYVAHHSHTPEALRIFIPKLLEMGYQFVTVSELIGSI
jgi:peptidoglycan/xylan/chitin deacetylase (PgdA/CDA1 family)